MEMESNYKPNRMEQCSFCFKTDKSTLKLFSLRYLCRHLKIEFKQLFFKCAKKTDHSEHDMLGVTRDLDKAEVNLCPECGKLIEKLTELFQSLEKIQMEVDWWLQAIQKLIIESDKDPKYLKGAGKITPIWAEMIKQVRKTVVNQTPNLSTLKPTLSLKRCNLNIKHDFENQDISVSDQEDSIGNSCVNYTGLGSGTIVKFEASEELAEMNDDIPHDGNNKASSNSDEESEPEKFPNKTIDNGIRLEGSKRVKCKKCSRTFSESSSFYKHYRSLHLDNKIHKCHLCPVKFSRRDHLSKHLMGVHGTKLEPCRPRPQVNSNYQCDIGDCNYKTEAKKSFKRHQLICKGKRKEKIKCQFCEEEFSNKSLLKRHEHQRHSNELQKYQATIISNKIIIESNGRKKVQCKICQVILIDPNSFGRHFRVAHLPQVIKCHLCPQKFARRDHLYRHLRISHNIEPIKTSKVPEQFKCDIGECNYVTKDKQTLRNHQKICKGISKVGKVGNFTCDVCGNGFENDNKLKTHKYYVHSGKIYKCVECGKELKRNNSLKAHIESVHLKIRHKCDHIGCESSYTDKNLLSMHRKRCEKPRPQPLPKQKEHFQEEIHQVPQQPQYSMDQAMENCIELARNKYQCKVCKKILKQKFNFRTHFKLRHVQTKVFECDICFKKFPERYKLQSHKNNVHANGQLYKCDKGECQYKTKSEIYLRKHQRYCRGVKVRPHFNSGDHMCSTCGKRFVSKDKLRRHQNQSHGGRKFVCDKCGKVFNAREGLRVHNRSEHLGIWYSCENFGCGKKFRTSANLRSHQSACLSKSSDRPAE